MFVQQSCSYSVFKGLLTNHNNVWFYLLEQKMASYQQSLKPLICSMFDFTFWSRKCLILPSGVENGLLSTIPQRWHDLDRSQLWQQGSVINQHCQNILKQSKSKILPIKHGSGYFNISHICCQRFAHLLAKQTFCANTIWRNFHSNVFNLHQMHNCFSRHLNI